VVRPCCMARRLQPALLFEDDVHQGRRSRHQPNGHGIAQLPVQFGHVVKVHAVHAGHE